MDKLIIKLFGINKFNFIGWVLAGFSIIIPSFILMLISIKKLVTSDFELIPTLLLAICILLFGIFCLSLQNYHSKLAEKLCKEQNKTT